MDCFGYEEVDFLPPCPGGESTASDRLIEIKLRSGEVYAHTADGHVLAVRIARTLYLATPFGLDIDNERLSCMVNDFLLARIAPPIAVSSAAPA